MYNSQDISNRIKAIAKLRNIFTGKMLLECGMNKNALSTMQSGGFLPRTETLAKIADYLDCSVDYLLGRTDEIKSKKTDRCFYQKLFTKYGLNKMRVYLRPIIENYGIERLADELDLEFDDIKLLLYDDTFEYSYKCWDRFCDVLTALGTDAYTVIHSIAINDQTDEVPSNYFEAAAKGIRIAAEPPSIDTDDSDDEPEIY